MWMCERCQSINEDAEAVCPRCGAEPVRPLTAGRPGAQPPASEPIHSGAPVDALPAEPVPSSGALPRPVEALDAAMPPMDQSVLPAASDHGTQRDPTSRSAIATLFMVMIALAAIGYVFFVGYMRGGNSMGASRPESPAQSDDGDGSGSSSNGSDDPSRADAEADTPANIPPPARDPDPNGIAGIWLGTDHSSPESAAVAYVFGTDGRFAAEGNHGPAGGLVHIDGTYKVSGQQVSIDMASMTEVRERQATSISSWTYRPPTHADIHRNANTLILADGDRTIALKRPQSIIGAWQAGAADGQGTARLVYVFQPDGTCLATLRVAGRARTQRGKYTATGGVLEVTAPNHTVFDYTFDGDDLLLGPRPDDDGNAAGDSDMMLDLHRIPPST